MNLSVEAVLNEEQAILDDLEMWGSEEKDAERKLHYICGVHDMANAVIRAIQKKGDKK